MAALALEISDTGLTALPEGKEPRLEPGYALFDGRRITTGETALLQARLKPRQVHNRFWAQLGEEEVPGTGLAQSDFAYAQLESLWQQVRDGVDRVLLVVPGFYRREQLGLLLGLAAELELPVEGVVDAAVAASEQHVPGCQRVHLDIGPQRIAATMVEQGGGQARRGRVVELPAVGLDSLRERWTRVIAQLFVAETRFDPLHRADTEQQLFDRLPGWLEQAGSQAELELRLPGREGDLQVVTPSASLLAVAEGVYRAIAQLIADLREPGEPLFVQLSGRMARLPGLASHLETLEECTVRGLASASSVRGALARAGAFRRGEQGVLLTLQLPFLGEPLELPVERPQPTPQRPGARSAPCEAVYVVTAGVAYPIDGRPLLVGTEVGGEGERGILMSRESAGVSRHHCELRLTREGPVVKDLSRFGTYLNGRRIAGEAPLKAGDVVRIGTPGIELAIVRIAEEGHGQEAEA